MGKKRRQRRQSHGSAWHWKQTDSWYCTIPGTKKRVPLFDDQGHRIRGKEGREAAEMALAKLRLFWEGESGDVPRSGGEWLVARVCSDYLEYCKRGVASGSLSKGHYDNAVAWLNDLCQYCGALRVAGYWNSGVGCSIEVLAELIGDTPKVAFDHYGREWGQHYQDPLWAAIGSGMSRP
jgi:hypothetical protein